ncbi:MAG: hypothetical protein WA738_20970 [Candidatus Angelobacter sp.]
MYWMVDGKKLSEEEYQQHQHKQEEEKARVRQETAALVKRLGETYAALTTLLQQNPGVSREVPDAEDLDQQIYNKLRQNLQRADRAPRCLWIKEDGTRCGSPQVRNQMYCYAHWQMDEALAKRFELPAPEDANAIQLSIFRVQTALIDDLISEKKAALLLYSLQIAAANVDKTTFGKTAPEEMVTEVGERKLKNLPPINRDDTDLVEGLPRVNAEGANRNGEGGRMLPQLAGVELAGATTRAG